MFNDDDEWWNELQCQAEKAPIGQVDGPELKKILIAFKQKFSHFVTSFHKWTDEHSETPEGQNKSIRKEPNVDWAAFLPLLTQNAIWMRFI